MQINEAILERHRTRIRFRNPDVDFAFSYMLGIADLVGAHGPLFAAVADIRRRSTAADWRREFGTLADRAHRHAVAAGADGRAEEARQWHLTDCYANRASLQFTPPDGPVFARRWQRMEDAFLAAMHWWQAPLTAIEVPFEDAHLPGYLLRIDDAPRAAIVMVGGGDTSREDLFAFIGLAAWQHGYNVIMVDLPGQGSAPARGLHFDVDMGRPISAVVDHLLEAAPATTHLTLYGVSGGGYFTCQAAASDPRVNAWIAGTPIYDVAQVFRREFGSTAHVPGPLRAFLARLAGRVNETAEISLARYAWQFGRPDFLTAVDDVFQRAPIVDVEGITSPSLFLYGEGEGPELQRQLQEVGANLTARGVPVTTRRFAAADGADAHCQVNNLRLAHAVIFDWLAAIRS